RDLRAVDLSTAALRVEEKESKEKQEIEGEPEIEGRGKGEVAERGGGEGEERRIDVVVLSRDPPGGSGLRPGPRRRVAENGVPRRHGVEGRRLPFTHQEPRGVIRGE